MGALGANHLLRRIQSCDAPSVSEPIHGDEPDTGEHVVRQLLEAECP